MDNFSNRARDDFSKARNRALFQSIIQLLGKERKELLPFDEVKGLVKPQSENYLGVKTIPVDKIVGSEGRYYDFTHTYLPKKEMLRSRWVSVDKAHLQNIVLPPIRVFKLGGGYFVRDGNHRVSVARMQGVEFIDAEVIELDSVISITPDMTQEDLKREITDYERKEFIENSGLGDVLDMEEIRFTAPGRYRELLNHIYGHKYYINLDKKEEIPLKEAAESWYKHVYLPVVELMKKEKVLSRFPRRTQADLYIWIVKHWDDLKRKYGEHFPLEDAAKDYSSKYGSGFLKRLKSIFTGSKKSDS